MAQIAVLGTEGAGKTVFVACLAKKLQDSKGEVTLEPRDLETQRYVERAWRQLRSGDWPPATTPGQIPVLEWSLRFAGQPAMPFRMIDPPGHDLRRLFAQDGRLESTPADLAPLAQIVGEAGVVLLLVNLADLVGEADDERRLVTELVVKFVLDSLLERPGGRPDVAIVLTQCDLFPQEVMAPRSPRSAIETHLPLVAQSEAFRALIADRIFPVAAVNKTRVVVDDDGRARRVPDTDFRAVGFTPLIRWIRGRPGPLPVKIPESAEPQKTTSDALGYVGMAVMCCLIFFLFRGCFRSSVPVASILSSEARYVYGLIDHAITVSGQVRNDGREGPVVIYAAVHDGRSLWKRSTTITLPAGGSSAFQIEFSEYQSGNAWYQVSVDPNSLDDRHRFQTVPR